MSRVEQPVPLVLASASPRRREILHALGLMFEIVRSETDESVRAGEEPLAYASRLAREKALEVTARIGGARARAHAMVLGADTIVVVDGDVLGKPRDDEDARAMIGRLAGRVHDVTTAVAVAAVDRGVLGQIAVTTRVSFRAIAADEITRYVESGDGRDKAGAYAVQGLGSGLVTRVDGSYSNVVGLPAAESLALLREVGAVGSWP